MWRGHATEDDGALHACPQSSWVADGVRRKMRGTCCFAIFLFLVYVLFFCSLRFFVTILHIFLFNNEATIGKRQLVRGVEGGERGEGRGEGDARLECVCKREGKMLRCVCAGIESLNGF